MLISSTLIKSKDHMKKIRKIFIAAGIAVCFLYNCTIASGEDAKVIEEVNSGSTFLNLRDRPVISEKYRKIENISSEYAVLLDEETNTVLAGKGAVRRVYPASLTKVLTLISALDLAIDTNVTAELTGEDISGLYEREASVAGFTAGEKIPFKDLLYGLILPSGADAALGIEKAVAGGKEMFSVMMNIEAFKMGLKDSKFTESTGLHNKNNYSTPLDLAVIFSYALDNKTGREVLSTPHYKIEDLDKHPEGLEVWSHTFSYMSDVDMGGFTITAGKTGYTGEAKVCMMTEAQKDGHKYILVTLFAPNSRTMCEDHINIYKEYTKQ